MLTCLLPTWSTTVGGPPSANGLVDNSNEENPVRDWGYLFVPYCTGDVHLGAREAAGVNFNGRANAQAALDWLFEAMPEPEATLTTGCSAAARLGPHGNIHDGDAVAFPRYRAAARPSSGDLAAVSPSV